MSDNGDKRHQALLDSYTARLRQYEQTYGMDSEVFYAAFQSGEIEEERQEFYEWRSIYSAWRHMTGRGVP